VRGQQLSFATDDSMSAACLAWTGPVSSKGAEGTQRAGWRHEQAARSRWPGRVCDRGMDSKWRCLQRSGKPTVTNAISKGTLGATN
jgi:hypothetical protein